MPKIMVKVVQPKEYIVHGETVWYAELACGHIGSQEHALVTIQRAIATEIKQRCTQCEQEQWERLHTRLQRILSPLAQHAGATAELRPDGYLWTRTTPTQAWHRSMRIAEPWRPEVRALLRCGLPVQGTQPDA